MNSPQPIHFDYHSHHWRCGHAKGDIADYVKAAIAAEMTDFGVSDHGPAYFLPGDYAKPTTQMAISAVAGYVTEAWKIKERYEDQINVRVGVEADYIPGREDDLREVLAAHRFEYALGSVHYALGTNIFDKNRWLTADPVEVYSDYYTQVATAAQSGMFDILSHLTAVESFGPSIDDDLANRLYTPVADAVAASGCLVEVNTSGYRKMNGDEPFPNRRMLRLLIARGVSLTFGSDCHRPEEVGFGRDRVLALLRELGVTADAVPTPTTRGTTLFAFPTKGVSA